MKFREFKDIVADNYKSVFPNSACTIGLGALGKDTFFVTYYLANDSSEFPNGISQNDLFHISFHIMQDVKTYGNGIKLDDDTELPETLILDVNHKTIATKPDNDYMAYGSISLPFRRTVGKPEKIIDTLKRYAEITKKTLTELYEEEALPVNQQPNIVDFVVDKLGLNTIRKDESKPTDNDGYYASYINSHSYKEMLPEFMKLWHREKDENGKTKFVLDCVGHNVVIEKINSDKGYSLWLDDKWFMDDIIPKLKRMGINFYFGNASKNEIEQLFKQHNWKLETKKTEDIGYDYWGPKEMEPFEGKAFIQYYDGPR